MFLKIKIKRLVVGLLAGSIVTIGSTGSWACTVMVITDVNGNAYSAKTMEFSYPIPLNMEYAPAGTPIRSKTPSGKVGIEFNTKYPILGLGMLTVPDANQDTMIEAINNQGLSINSNEFNDSRAPADLGHDAHKILAATDFAMWVLGNFQSKFGYPKYLLWVMLRCRYISPFLIKQVLDLLLNIRRGSKIFTIMKSAS